MSYIMETSYDNEVKELADIIWGYMILWCIHINVAERLVWLYKMIIVKKELDEKDILEGIMR